MKTFTLKACIFYFFLKSQEKAVGSITKRNITIVIRMNSNGLKKLIV